ncbi:MAG TPA: OmpA family protein [Pseudonocardia sp.]|uniref:OmpA family protein n=1 Tax=Pseudonocardia sp. TaxID=60912 RepID=UPI002ED86968
MRRVRRGLLARSVVLAVVLTAALAGCTGGPGGGKPVPPLSAPTGSGDGSGPAEVSSAPAPSQGEGIVAKPQSTALPLEARNIRLVRQGSDELVLQFEFYNGTAEKLAPDNFGIDRVQRLLLLIDLPRRTGYSVLSVPNTGAADKMSANVDEYVQPGQSATVTAVFAAPPAETTTMLVAIDPMLPMQVPVQPAGPALTPDPILTAPTEESRAFSPLVCSATQQGGQTEFRLPSDVLFAFGSATLSPAAQAALDSLAAQVTGKAGTVIAQGNTDSIGDDPSNQRLSEQRANAVSQVLQQKLGADFDYTPLGFGETKPIAPNTKPDGSDYPDGRAQNRRVDVMIKTAAATPQTALLPPGQQLANEGLKASVAEVRRVDGYLMTTYRVTNPGTEQARFDYSVELSKDEVADGELTVLDSSGQNHAKACTVAAPVYFALAGTMGTIYGMHGLSNVPAGATVTMWGLTPDPAPNATSVNVQLGGFPQSFPAPVTPGG